VTAWVVVALAAPARAQSGGGRTAAWTAAGAGAGFGVGLWAGLTAFDDAINSDRKVWTSAILGAAVGGTLAYLVSRPRRGGASPSLAAPDRRRVSTPRPATVWLDEREVARLAALALPPRWQPRAP
jgi:hypothetical protein